MVTCTSTIPTGHELALVTLRNIAGYAVRDINDISNPVTRCTVNGQASDFRFLSATRLSYIVSTDNGSGALYAADLQTRATSLVRSWTNEGALFWVYAWSPDGTTLSYLSSAGDQVAWHLLSPAGDVKLSGPITIPGRDVDPNSDDAMVGFSADGKYVALEQTFGVQGSPAPPFQVVRLSDHKLVYSRTNGTMATWGAGGASLYFRTTLGVEAWDPIHGVRVVVPQGLRWIRPWPSADGKLIAYEDTDNVGNHFPGYVRLADSQAFRVSQLPRASAVFLTPTLMWYVEESVCSATVQCGLGGPPQSGRTYIKDLITGKESASIITAVFDTWPHA